MKREIDRLAKEIAEAKAKIADTEASCLMGREVFENIYKTHLCHLEAQRAELTSKIGKKQ